MWQLRRHAAALTLLSLLLASWALLTWQLGQRSLWVDEFFSRQMIRGSLGDVVAAAMGDLHPPLYFRILHAWIALAGASDFALRFPSSAFALCGLTLIPGVARRLSGAHVVKPALILLCFAPAFIELSRMARYYHSPYYLMPYWPGVPAVLTCDDLIPLIFPQHFAARQRLIYRSTHRLAVNTAQRIIAVSHSTGHDLQRFLRVSPDRVMVIHEGVDGHFKPSSRAEIDRVRQDYVLPDRYVLYFGSNKPYKNVPRLVEAFALSGIGDQGSGIGLVIAGHWDERYLEAKQDAAILCNPPDAADIALALKRVLDDAALRFTLQQRALERAARFTWEQAAQLTKNAYQQAMAG